jgi:endonuclease-3
MEELTSLPGIGRKTANVVLGTAFGKPAIFVDTHVRRLAGRLGLSFEDEPERIERDLRALLPPRGWTAFAHRLIHHGRRICVARKPRCSACPLAPWCPRIGVTVSA